MKWQKNRRFALMHLRDLGLGKLFVEDTIKYEVDALLKVFDDHVNKPYEMSWDINTAVFNVIWGLVACKYFVLFLFLKKYNFFKIKHVFRVFILEFFSCGKCP